MRKSVRLAKCVDTVCPHDPEKLNDDQALHYLSRLWVSIDEEKAQYCLYIDPLLIKDYYENKKGREKFLMGLLKRKFFERRYVFFPTCLWNHWFLLVLCNPSNNLEGGSDKPTIILLDSLKGSISNDIEDFIRGMLISLFKYAKRNCSLKKLMSIPLLIPEVPKQRDVKSCGFFMLFYTTMFLKMCPEVFSLTHHYPSFMTKNWFLNEEIEDFRISLLNIFAETPILGLPLNPNYDAKGSGPDFDLMNLIQSCDSKGCVRKPMCAEVKKKRNKEQLNQDDVIDGSRLKKLKGVSNESCGSDQLQRENDIVINKGHKLLIKMSPSIFSDMIHNLTEAQIDWVKGTGFGSILDFQLHGYPKYLGYCLVKCFDPDVCCIVLGNKTIKITDVDVHRVLGLPLGNTLIPFVNSQPLSKEWRKQYKDSKKCFRVAVKDVVNAIKESNTVDVNFKKNFISLLICFLIQAPSNSYIRQKLLGFCCDLDKCSNYNWCEFVVRALKNSQKFWLRNTETRHYTGSLAFLVYFYLDTFIGRRSFPENIRPRFISWNNYNLELIEELMIQRSFINVGELMVPDIHYLALESCRKKRMTEFSDTEVDANSKFLDTDKSENEAHKSPDNVENEFDWDHVPKSVSKGVEWNTVLQSRQTSSHRYNEQCNTSVGNMEEVVQAKQRFSDKSPDMNSYNLLESLLDSYHSIQQTFVLHVLSAKRDTITDRKVEDIKNAFIEMNDKANMLLH